MVYGPVAKDIAPTLVILREPEPPRSASAPVENPPPPGFGEIERVQFRDEPVMYKWWRLRPNLPLDPAPAKPEHSDPALCTEELRITTPDTGTTRGAIVTKRVHPEMVGDYERAGWRRV
jgi:hypothetical protein